MVTEQDILDICMSLPGVVGDAPLAVRCKDRVRGIAWVWQQRIEPKQPRVPCHEVYAVRTPSLDEKEALIASDPAKHFTEPHYNHFPAVLVRLAEVSVEEMEELLVDGWRAVAPKALLKEYSPEKLRQLVRERREREIEDQ